MMKYMCLFKVCVIVCMIYKGIVDWMDILYNFDRKNLIWYKIDGCKR